QQLRQYMMEEQMRRDKLTLTIDKICSFPVETWIQPFVEAHAPKDESDIYAPMIAHVAAKYPHALSDLKKALSFSTRQGPGGADRVVDIRDPETYEPIITLPDWMVLPDTLSVE